MPVHSDLTLKQSGYIAFMSRFLTGIPIQPMKLRSDKMVEIKCPFMSRFLGAEFLKGEISECTRIPGTGVPVPGYGYTKVYTGYPHPDTRI